MTRSEALEQLMIAQRERFAEDFARIYAAEQCTPDEDEVITDPRDIRGS